MVVSWVDEEQQCTIFPAHRRFRGTAWVGTCTKGKLRYAGTVASDAETINHIASAETALSALVQCQR